MAHILTVEDEQDLQEILCEELETFGHIVVPAAHGKEALEKLESFSPDLIISDIVMPKMNGYELLENVRERYPQLADTPFLFLSASASREEELEARSKGADGYIRKPVDFDVLQSILASRLRQIQRMRELREQQFVKLYNALASSDAAPAQTPAAASSGIHRSNRSPDRSPNNGAPGFPSQAATQYGTIFRFPNLRKVAREAGADYPALWQAVRKRATELLKLMLFDEDVVANTADGGLFVSHRNASIEEAADESGRLSKALHTGLVQEQNGNGGDLALPPELVQHALVVSEVLFEITISRKEAEDPGKFGPALLGVMKRVRSEERAPTLLVRSMRNDGASLHPLSLISAKENAIPVRFFSFDESSKRKMRACFAFFGEENSNKASYLIDTLSLDLLEGAARQTDPKDAIVVDVNFATLNTQTFASMYARKFREFAENSGHPVMINLRSIPHGVSFDHVDGLFKRLGNHSARRCMQIKPDTIGDFSDFEAPVSGVVVSYPELVASGTALERFAAVKPRLAGAKTLLVLRGVPGHDHIPQFNRYGFDGYAVEPPPAD